MKKTKKTILTAAILTAASASAASPDAIYDADAMRPVYGPPPSYSETTPVMTEVALVYGPPSYFENNTQKLGDANNDGNINIADYCLMLGLKDADSYDGDPSLSDDVRSLILDINNNGFVDKYDFLSMRRYLFGLDDDIYAYMKGDKEAAEIDKEPDVTEETEGTEVTDCSWIPDSETIQSIVTTYGQHAFFESVRMSREAEYNSTSTLLTSPIIQTKYGVVPIYNKESVTTDVPDEVIKETSEK